MLLGKKRGEIWEHYRLYLKLQVFIIPFLGVHRVTINWTTMLLKESKRKQFDGLDGTFSCSKCFVSTLLTAYRAKDPAN
jgi:hypothetical protein